MVIWFLVGFVILFLMNREHLLSLVVLMKIVQACPIPSLQPFFIDESRLLVSRESKTDKVDFVSVSLINRKHMLCLTLIGAGGGGAHPLLMRSTAICEGIILMFSNLLTF